VYRSLARALWGSFLLTHETRTTTAIVSPDRLTAYASAAAKRAKPAGSARSLTCTGLGELPSLPQAARIGLYPAARQRQINSYGGVASIGGQISNPPPADALSPALSSGAQQSSPPRQQSGPAA